MFFDDFPSITYLYHIDGKNDLRVVKDITRNIRVKKNILSNITLYEDYDIVDGDTPENIADKVYGNPNLNWVVMLVNERFSNLTDFPLTNDQLEKYVFKKYGNQREAQHLLYGNLHFETPEGRVTWQETAQSKPVSNFEYEFKVNENKRRIKLIHPKFIPKILRDLKDAVNTENF